MSTLAVTEGRLRVSRRRTRPRDPRVLMTTEGTYPYAIGGVSSWCDLIVKGIGDVHWMVLPVVAGDRRPRALFQLPDNVQVTGHIDVWSERLPRRRVGAATLRNHARVMLPAELARALVGWQPDPSLVGKLLWCRKHASELRGIFRSSVAWREFVLALRELTHETDPLGGIPPEVDTVQAARLYQTLYWIARAAAVPTPSCDLLHVTAAGWAAIPALVHKAVSGTPMLLTEHGVYVREAYLAVARSPLPDGERFLSARLARGMALAAYAAADIIAPVTEANARWEIGLGVSADRIRVIHNGIDAPEDFTPPPGDQRVVSVGRIDPLKDVQTMLHVAVEVCRRVPGATFQYWGPPTKGREAYAAACEELRGRLQLGDRFRFMGSTSDPHGVVRDADVVLMTSISEALPMSVLEAMAQARPVVATGVGGVPDVLRGCGIAVPPGNVHAIATGVATLLRNPGLGEQMGRRGFDAVHRRFTRSGCVDAYADLIREMAA